MTRIDDNEFCQQFEVDLMEIEFYVCMYHLNDKKTNEWSRRILVS